MNTSWSVVVGRSSGAHLLRACVSAAFILGLAMSTGALPLHAVAAPAAWTPASPVAGTSALAPAHWSVVPSPNVTAPQGKLNAVSCTSATGCTAVGFYEKPIGTGATVTLAERWNGKAWKVQPTPSVPEMAGSGPALSDVSCTSAKACLAVGSVGGSIPLAERWNGKIWSIVPAVKPAGSYRSVLSGVSCPAANSCIAVGHYSTDYSAPDTTLAERWDGRRWSIQPTPNPDTFSLLSGVSCTSAKACVAVGYSYTATRPDPECIGQCQTLVERWTGNRWKIQSSPNRIGVSSSVLSAVSCFSGKACIAVGYYTNHGATPEPLAEGWNGKTWAILPTPKPAGGSSLSHVSCTSAKACTAVGGTAERWNGKKWSVQRTPPGSLVGVSCPSNRACVAVGNRFGDHYYVTQAERWNGKKWTIQPTPSTIIDGYLLGVSCTSDNNCVAAGVSGDVYDGQSLAEHWNGKRWAIRPSPYANLRLMDLSCSSSSACMAVAFPGEDNWRTAGERWDGMSWTVQSPLVPENAMGSWLAGVSCTSATGCMAVGYWYPSPNGDNGCPGSDDCVTLAERWNGTSWTILPTPNDGAYSVLMDVSCTSSSACTAVGYGNDRWAPKTLVERWNGKTWSIQASPTPPGTKSIALTGVSCASPTACTAVGNYNDDAGNDNVLVERWDGNTWSIQPAPKPATARTSELTSVSCISSGACTAVGDYAGSSTGPRLALVESWNGKTWSVQPAPSPGGSHGTYLTAVSCTSMDGAAGAPSLAPPTCTAVGHYNNGYDDMTLIERRS